MGAVILKRAVVLPVTDLNLAGFLAVNTSGVVWCMGATDIYLG